MNINQLKTLLGDKKIYRSYLENLDYYVGDLCFFDDNADEKIIKRCIKDTTGPFDSTAWEDPKEINGYVSIVNDTVEIFNHKNIYNSDDYPTSDIMKFKITFPKSGINNILIRAFSLASSVLVSEVIISLLNTDIKDTTCVKKIGETFLSFDKPVQNANGSISINIYFNITDELKYEIYSDDVAIDVSNVNSYTPNPDIGVKYGFYKSITHRYTNSLCDSSALLSIKDWNNSQITEFSTPLIKMNKLFSVYKSFFNANKDSINSDINTTDVILSSIEDKISFINTYLNSGLPTVTNPVDDSKIKLISDTYEDPEKPKNREIESFRKLIANAVDSVPATLSKHYHDLDTIPIQSNNMTLLSNTKTDLNFNMVKAYTDYTVYDMKVNENLLYVLYGNSTSCFIDVIKSDKNVFDNLVGTYDLKIFGTKLHIIDSNIALILNKDLKLLYAITIGLSKNVFSIDSTYVDIIDIEYTDNYIVLLKDSEIISLKYDKKSFFDKKIYQKPDPLISSIKVIELNDCIYIYSLVENKIIVFDLNNNQLATLDSYHCIDFKVSIYGTIYAIVNNLNPEDDEPSKFIIYDFSTFNFIEIASEYLSFIPTNIYVSKNGNNIMITGNTNSQIYQYNKHFNIIKKCLNPNINSKYLNKNGFLFINNALLYLYTYSNGIYYNYIDNYLPSYGGLTNKNVIYSTSCNEKFAILSLDDETDYSVIIYDIIDNKEIHIYRTYIFNSIKPVNKFFLLNNIFIYYTIDENDEVSIYCMDISKNSISSTFKKISFSYQIGIHNIEKVQTTSNSIIYPIIDVDTLKFVEVKIESNPLNNDSPIISENIISYSNQSNIDDIVIKTALGDKIFFISKNSNTKINNFDVSNLSQLIKQTNKLINVSKRDVNPSYPIIAADFNNSVSFISDGKIFTTFNRYKDTPEPTYVSERSIDLGNYNLDIATICPLVTTQDSSTNYYSSILVIFSNGVIYNYKFTFYVNDNTMTRVTNVISTKKFVIPSSLAYALNLSLKDSSKDAIIVFPTSPGYILASML